MYPTRCSDARLTTLRANFYHPNSVLKDGKVVYTIFSETDPEIHARAIPYLEAVMREAMRMHPGVGMPLEHYVSKGGLTVNGHYLLPGIMVGINAWISGMGKTVYGEDAEVFRPERWLQEDGEDEAVYEERFCK